MRPLASRRGRLNRYVQVGRGSSVEPGAHVGYVPKRDIPSLKLVIGQGALIRREAT